MYNEAIRLNPQYVEAYNNKGHSYFLLNQNEIAMEMFDQALRLNENSF